MRALVLALVCSAPAWAGPLADRALDAFDNADYAQAARLMSRALGDERFDSPSLARAYLVLGTAWLALGDEDQAAAAFATLYALDPTLRPDPDSSPKVRQALERAAHPGWPPPGIEHHAPPHFTGELVRLEADVTAAPRLQPIVEYRVGRQQRARMPLDCVASHCQARLPVGNAAELEYRLALVTPEGALALPTPTVLLDRAPPPPLPPHPHPSAPTLTLTQTPTPTETKPAHHDHKRIWIWSGIAVAAAAVVSVGLGVGLTARTFPANQPVVPFAR